MEPPECLSGKVEPGTTLFSETVKRPITKISKRQFKNSKSDDHSHRNELHTVISIYMLNTNRNTLAYKSSQNIMFIFLFRCSLDPVHCPGNWL